jgi:hypothetical protein
MISVKDGLSFGSSAQQLLIIYIICGGQSGGIEERFGLFFSIVTCLTIAIGVDS